MSNHPVAHTPVFACAECRPGVPTCMRAERRLVFRHVATGAWSGCTVLINCTHIGTYANVEA